MQEIKHLQGFYLLHPNSPRNAIPSFLVKNHRAFSIFIIGNEIR